MRSLLVIFVVGFLGGAAGPTGQEKGTSPREVYLTRVKRLQNLMVDYKVTTRYTPQIPRADYVRTNAGGSTTVMDTGTRVTAKQFSILQDNLMYRAEDQSWDRGFDHPFLAKIASQRKTVYARTPGRVEQFRGDSLGPGYYQGEVSAQARLPDEGDLEVGLGLRVLGATDVLTLKDIEKMGMSRAEDGKVSLRGATDHNAPVEWLLDPNLGYAPVRYRFYYPNDQTVVVEFTMDDFRPVGGLMLPFRMRAERWAGPDKKTVNMVTVEVSTFRLEDATNTPQRYHIDWPEGTLVVDNVAGLRFKAAKSSPPRGN